MDDLELIKQKINIIDLIQEYLPLKKSGVNFKANCPFHQEKTPSFVVSPERGIFKCFGCGVGGDIFKFLMLKEGLDFPEALEVLAKKAGITLERRKTEEKDQKQRLLEANQKAAQYFHYLLTKHNLGKKALEYLKKRGVSEKTIEEFNLGYAPNSWESLSRFLTKKGFTAAELIEAGLLIASPKGGYDRFRGRIIFPLVNFKNETVGFAGRILETDGLSSANPAASGPKYLNTPQTRLFDKGSFLFGLNLAKPFVRSKKSLILVEGLMDMVMSYQAGITNVAATQGTSLTQNQIDLMKKYTDNIYLCFDADIAGDSASRRGIEMLDRSGLNLKVVAIKEGKDPADLVAKDANLWLKAIEEAEPIYDYYLRSVSQRFNPKIAADKKRIAEELLPIWAKISDPLTLDHYLQKLAAFLSTSEEVLRRLLRVKGGLEISFAQIFDSPKNLGLNLKPRREILEEYLLALILKMPKGITFVPSFSEKLFFTKEAREFFVLLVLYLDSISFQGTNFKISELAKEVPNELLPFLDRLYLKEIDDKLEDVSNWQKEVNKVIDELKKALIKASLEKLSAQIKNAQFFGKINELETLNRRFRDLSIKLKNL